MSMPGFSAESSVYRSTGSYVGRVSGVSPISKGKNSDIHPTALMRSKKQPNGTGGKAICFNVCYGLCRIFTDKPVDECLEDCLYDCEILS
ncbi:hypothetical protein [Fischerella sp. PCC 9605]|uniref:hypothetical protein n=1 Tax=Fischerella sp. PCC 9605 TaxID=1173024 RepID=UPI0012DEEA90|nr:hypothetical protein [Fischerella sp. PCC 9605]